MPALWKLDSTEGRTGSGTLEYDQWVKSLEIKDFDNHRVILSGVGLAGVKVLRSLIRAGCRKECVLSTWWEHILGLRPGFGD